MSEPCQCHACVVAGIDRPSITIPGFRQIPAKELHGVALRDHYAAQDRLRATIDQVRKQYVEVTAQDVAKATAVLDAAERKAMPIDEWADGASEAERLVVEALGSEKGNAVGADGGE